MINNTWQGGHPGGSTGKKYQVYSVRFDNKTIGSFKIKDYESEQNAKQAAKKLQKEYSDKEGLTRNMYRYVDDYIEVKLQDGFIGKISPEDLHLFTQIIWCSQKGNKRYYIAHSGKKSKNIPSQRFHRLIFPEWEQIDHINRNGLDNRRINLRDGTKAVNNHNQGKRTDNISGKTGVSWHVGKNSWVIQWKENSKRMQKYFRVGPKRSMEVAKELAIQFRVQKDMKLNIDNGYDSDCEDKEETFEKQLPEHMYTLSLTSNVKGVYYSENRWCATWRINNKTITKRYSVKKYGEETAKSLAITKRAEMVGPNLIFYD